MSRHPEGAQIGSESGACLFTVDLEEYFEVKLLRDFIPATEWDSLPARAQRSVDPLLGFLDRYGARATFFASPWVATSRPTAVRKVAAGGHEVGVLMRMPAREVEPQAAEDVWKRTLRDTRDRLEQLTGRRVLGCRSARFHHELPAADALRILAEEGLRYDSTLNRDQLASLAEGEAPDFPARVPTPSGPVLGVPPTTLGLFGRRLFTVGRTSFRVLPLAVTRRVLAADRANGYGGVFCLRSWEMDPAQPTLPVSLASRVRLYWGLDRVHSRLDRLFQKFRFDSVVGATGLEVEPISPDAGTSRTRGEERPDRPRRSMHG